MHKSEIFTEHLKQCKNETYETIRKCNFLVEWVLEEVIVRTTHPLITLGAFILLSVKVGKQIVTFLYLKKHMWFNFLWPSKTPPLGAHRIVLESREWVSNVSTSASVANRIASYGLNAVNDAMRLRWTSGDGVGRVAKWDARHGRGSKQRWKGERSAGSVGSTTRAVRENTATFWLSITFIISPTLACPPRGLCAQILCLNFSFSARIRLCLSSALGSLRGLGNPLLAFFFPGM